MIERGRGTGFRLKAGEGFGLRMMAQRNRLDGDFTAEARVAGAIHLAHAAGAELLKDFVCAEARYPATTWTELDLACAAGP